MISNKAFLQAVDGLRDDWVVLLGDEGATTLEQWMAETTFDDAESVRQTTGQVLDLVAAHPEVKLRISGELGIKGELSLSVRAYDPLAGEDTWIPPGTLMVCPVDPSHYRKPLRQKGQMCPLHGVELVPEDQVESKE